MSAQRPAKFIVVVLSVTARVDLLNEERLPCSRSVVLIQSHSGLGPRQSISRIVERAAPPPDSNWRSFVDGWHAQLVQRAVAYGDSMFAQIRPDLLARHASCWMHISTTFQTLPAIPGEAELSQPR
jgi:hypothetical protein